jgi:hypothetical protein
VLEGAVCESLKKDKTKVGQVSRTLSSIVKKSSHSNDIELQEVNYLDLGIFLHS